MSERPHYTAELLRFHFVDGADVLSDDLMNLAAAAERAVNATEEINLGASNALSALATAASVLVRGQNNVSPTSTRGNSNSSGRGASSSSHRGASNSSGRGASPTAPHRRAINSTGHGTSPTAPHRNANNSSGHGASPTAPHRSASNSSSPYYGEMPTCIVCTDEMMAPGVTDAACDHRSTCTPCLCRILFYARGQASCPLCRETYYRVL